MADTLRPRRTQRTPKRLEAEAEDADIRKAILNSLKQVKRVEHEVPEAPVFYPTAEEFQDPLKYISRISATASKTGICKIVPPEGFQPKTTFPRERSVKFPTKRQLVNRLQEGKVFKTGGRYLISEYMKYAEEFTKKYRADKSFPCGNPSDSDQIKKDSYARLEKEFWRIVETNVEEIAVDYANDLDTAKYGSPFDYDPCHTWNFNKLHDNSLSLLKELKYHFPGITHPWLYLGSLFTTFCWHTEDHFLYSINYMHSGAAKTWYGIPSTSAEKFEQALKQFMPDRFKEAPDLIYQLVALLSPSFCVDQGVEVYHTVQETGDFIVTFPNAYHGGFSHGLNCAEAVNFAIPEWLPYGSEAIEKYHKCKGSRRMAVFPNDELLWRLVYKCAKTASEHRQQIIDGQSIFSILQESLPYDMASFGKTLVEEFRKGVDKELHLRKWLQSAGMSMKESNSALEVSPTCWVCKSMPFYSYVTCSEHGRTTCPKHAYYQCDCKSDKKTLNVTIKDKSLNQMCQLVESIENSRKRSCNSPTPAPKKQKPSAVHKEVKSCVLCGARANSRGVICVSCDNYYHIGCIENASIKDPSLWTCEYCKSAQNMK